MVQYDLQFSHSGTTFRAFCTSQQGAYQMQGQEFVSRPKFVKAWWEWNRARHIDFERAYECAALPPEQRVYVIDVTRLGIKKKFWSAASCSGCRTSAQAPLRGWSVHFAFASHPLCSAIDNRVLIRDKDTRELLLAYARATKAKPLAKKDALALRRGLEGEHWRTLFGWIDTTLSKSPSDFLCYCPPALSRLLEAIAMPSPAPGFLLRPSELVPVLRDIAASPARVYPRTSARVLSLLQDNCPLLYHLLHSELCRSGSGEFTTFPVPMKPLLNWLAESCDKILQGAHPPLS